MWLQGVSLPLRVPRDASGDYHDESIGGRLPFLLASLFVICCLVLFPRTLQAASLPDVIDVIRPGIVGVGKAYPPRQPLPKKKSRLTFTGTGFVVGNGKQIVTNAHVLPGDIDTDNNESLVVLSGAGGRNEAHLAKVVRVDEQHDLALLTIASRSLKPLKIGDSDRVREGQGIAFTGFPIGVVLGLFPVTHQGIVAAITPMARPADDARTLSAAQIRRMRNQFDAFQLDAVAYPGNSGSPVYEPDTGLVIGVVNSVLVKESRESLLTQPSGISYAIPSKYVKLLLQAAR